MSPSPMQPSVIAFDVFGTLVKIEKRRSPFKKLMQWLQEQGRTPKPDDASVIMSQRADFEKIAMQFGWSIPEQLHQELVSDLETELQSIELYEDALSTLEQLKNSGFRLALCSNLAMPYGEVVLSMLPTLDAYAWSYEVGAIKPDAQIYQYLIEQLGCQAEDVLFIGDTLLADVIGPTEFGMNARLIDRRNGQKFVDILADILG